MELSKTWLACSRDTVTVEGFSGPLGIGVHPASQLSMLFYIQEI